MPRVVPASRLPHVPVWLVLLYAAWGAAVALVFVASRTLGVRADLCPLHAATGLPCPLCGGTRATVHLASLDPLAALAMNPLVAVGLPALALVLGLRLLTARWIRLEGPPTRRRAIRNAAIAAAALLVLANWGYLLAFQPGAHA